MQRHSDPEIQVLREGDKEAKNVIRQMLFNDKYEKYAKWNKLLKDPVFHRKYN